jgi:hypothetical protein
MNIQITKLSQRGESLKPKGRSIRSKHLFPVGSLLILGLFIARCTDLNEDIRQHPDGWLDSTSVNFHGKKVAYSGIVSCTTCHGDNYKGGTSGVSCYQCHDGPSGHPEGMTNPSSTNFHGLIFWDNNWDLSRCKTCHGNDLKGGVSELSCYQCHNFQSCNTCHGYKFDAVFEDLRSETDHTTLTVGAHTSHLQGSHSLREPLDCSDCHVVPDSLFSATHMDGDGQAEVTFGSLATDSGKVTPQWDRTQATCTQTWCHGNFSFAKATSSNDWAYAEETIRGNDTTVVWIATDQATCGTCHTLPPVGHNQGFTTCGSCHGTVVASDDSTIVGLDKHINGQKNYP